MSQDVVVGRNYEAGTRGFNTFLHEISMWKNRKDKKIKDKQNEACNMGKASRM